MAARRAAARAAARRRRRVLYVLLGLDLLVVGLAAFALLPWWGVAVPVTLTLGFLVLARTQVRRQDDELWSPSAVAARVRDDTPRPDVPLEVADDVVPRRAIRVEAPYGTVLASDAGSDREFSADEETVQISYSQLEAVAVPMETVDGGSLWDPLPVTLPTYVGKAKAARTVRTIDLSAPGSWTSGRDEADTALVEQAAAAETARADEEQADARKAVGS